MDVWKLLQLPVVHLFSVLVSGTLVQSTLTGTPVNGNLTSSATPSAIPTIGFEIKDYDRGLAEAFAAQFLAYLNAGGSPSALEQQGVYSEDPDLVTILPQVVIADVSGDSQPEVVISVQLNFGASTEGAVLVYSAQADQYELFGQFLTGSAYDSGLQRGWPRIAAIADVTGNGVPEIIFAYYGNIGMDGGDLHVSLYEWDGAAFVDLAPQYDYLSEIMVVDEFSGAPRIEATDLNQDDRLDLVVTSGTPDPYPGGEAATTRDPRRSQSLWAWDGETFILECTRWLGSSVFLHRVVDSGDGNLSCGLYSDALEDYQQALEDDTLLPWVKTCADNPGNPSCVSDAIAAGNFDVTERPRLMAYVHYRLMLTYLALQQPDTASVYYDALRESSPSGSPGYPYAQLAEAFWQTYLSTDDLALACQEAVQYAADHKAAILRPFDTYYPDWFHEEWLMQPGDICLPT